MSEFKGTPGPWEIKPEEVDKHYIRIRGTQLGGRYKIANVLTPVYEGVHEREAKETRANTRLIAAAPELLEALQGFYDYYNRIYGDDGDYHDEHPIAVVKAAIAKALGETK